MRHPTRTRRLPIAAIASLLAFVVVSGASIRSLWTWDLMAFGAWEGITIQEGRIVYLRSSGGPTGHFSGSIYDEHAVIPWGILGFYVKKTSLPPNASIRELKFVFAVPLWPALFLLLFAPMRWLIARPAAAPAFPVVTKQLQRVDRIPVMADQKPTLEYGRPQPSRKDWQFDMTACVVCSILGVGFLLSSDLPDIVQDGYGVLLKPACGFLLLWFAWWLVKRR